MGVCAARLTAVCAVPSGVAQGSDEPGMCNAAIASSIIAVGFLYKPTNVYFGWMCVYVYVYALATGDRQGHAHSAWHNRYHPHVCVDEYHGLPASRMAWHGRPKALQKCHNVSSCRPSLHAIPANARAVIFGCTMLMMARPMTASAAIPSIQHIRHKPSMCWRKAVAMGAVLVMQAIRLKVHALLRDNAAGSGNSSSSFQVEDLLNSRSMPIDDTAAQPAPNRHGHDPRLSAGQQGLSHDTHATSHGLDASSKVSAAVTAAAEGQEAGRGLHTRRRLKAEQGLSEEDACALPPGRLHRQGESAGRAPVP